MRCRQCGCTAVPGPGEAFCGLCGHPAADHRVAPAEVAPSQARAPAGLPPAVATRPSPGLVDDLAASRSPGTGAPEPRAAPPAPAPAEDVRPGTAAPGTATAGHATDASPIAIPTPPAPKRRRAALRWALAGVGVAALAAAGVVGYLVATDEVDLAAFGLGSPAPVTVAPPPAPEVVVITTDGTTASAPVTIGPAASAPAMSPPVIGPPPTPIAPTAPIAPPLPPLPPVPPKGLPAPSTGIPSGLPPPPPTREQGPPVHWSIPDPQWLQDGLNRELAAQGIVGITASVAPDMIVTLRGATPDPDQKARAIRLALAQQGARAVLDQVFIVER
jgi:hypothetical protein